MIQLKKVDNDDKRLTFFSHMIMLLPVTWFQLVQFLAWIGQEQKIFYWRFFMHTAHILGFYSTQKLWNLKFRGNIFCPYWLFLSHTAVQVSFPWSSWYFSTSEFSPGISLSLTLFWHLHMSYWFLPPFICLTDFDTFICLMHWLAGLNSLIFIH